MLSYLPQLFNDIVMPFTRALRRLMASKSIIHEHAVLLRMPLLFSFGDQKIRSFIRKQSAKRFESFKRQLTEETIVEYRARFDKIVKNNGNDKANILPALYLASLYHPAQQQSKEIEDLFHESPKFTQFKTLAINFYNPNESGRKKLLNFDVYTKQCQEMISKNKTYKQFVNSRKLLFTYLLICPDLI